jgi:hypothetical protein
MQWLKQSTAVKPLVGPFVADTDGVTPVTFLSSDADAFGLVKHGSTTFWTLDSNALVVTSDATAFAHLTLGATDVDTLGMLDFVAQDASLCLPVMSRFMVVSAGAYGAQITGTDAIASLQTSDVQAELVTYAGAKSTDVATLSSDLLALNDLASSDIQAELVTYDAATGTELAALNDLASSDIQAELVTYDAATGTEVAAIPTTNLDSSDIPTAAVIADAVWDEKSTDHVAAGSLGKAAVEGVTLRGTAAAGDTTIKITLTGGVAADNYYNGQLVIITGGTGAGQARTILKYLSSGTAATPTRDFSVAPDNTSTFIVVGADVPSILEAGIATAGAAASITLDATAPATVDIFKNNFIMISGGTGAGQTRLIGAYSAGRVATVLPNWTTIPDTTSIYQVLPAARVDIQGWAGNVVTGDGDWAALNNLASSDIQAELVTYDAVKGTEAAWASDVAALNNLADTDILGYTLETGYTVAQAMKLWSAALAGKSSGGGTTSIIFRDLADGADRITATVDSDGDRTAMTLNP